MFRPNTGIIYEWHLSSPREDKGKPYSWDYLNLYGDNKRTDIKMDWETKTLIFIYYGASILLLDNNSKYFNITDALSTNRHHVLFTLDDTDYTGKGIIAELDTRYYVNFLSYDNISNVKYADTYMDGISIDNKLLLTTIRPDINLLTFVTQDILNAKIIDIPNINSAYKICAYPDRGIQFINCETLYCFPNQICKEILEAMPKLKTIIIKGKSAQSDEELVEYAKENNINIYELTHIFENGDIIEKHGFRYEYPEKLIFNC